MSDLSSESKGGGGSMRKFLEVAGLVLGIPAALATVLPFLGFKIVNAEDHINRQELQREPSKFGYIEKSKCEESTGLNREEPVEPSPIDIPEMNKTNMPIRNLEDMIQEALAIKEHTGGIERIGRATFFDRFDRWRSNSKEALKEADKVIQSLGLPSSEAHADSFDTVTHIKRNVDMNPYTPREYEQFLEDGIEVLARAKGILEQNELRTTAPRDRG